MKHKKVELLMAVMIIMFALFFSKVGVQIVSSQKVKMGPKKVIVLDSGHGGVDAGKVSLLGDYEKDINLSIAKKLKKLLEKKGYTVVMTRTKDVGLYTEGSSNKKIEDMRKRCAIINGADAVLAVSIHQNSYHEEGIKGAQVFYYGDSDAGKLLAECMQQSLIKNLDKGNTRTAKSNNSYYLLKNTQIPTVIVECGFLSNYGEAKELVSEGYQKKVAKAILKGIEDYMEKENEDRGNQGKGNTGTEE